METTPVKRSESYASPRVALSGTPLNASVFSSADNSRALRPGTNIPYRSCASCGALAPLFPKGLALTLLYPMAKLEFC